MKYECMFLEGEMSSQKLNYSVNDTLSSANVEFFWTLIGLLIIT